MYPFIKVSGKSQKKIFGVFVTAICSLVAVYWLLVGVMFQTNNAIIYHNTQKVLNDDSKVRVEHINTDGRIYLEDGSKFEDKTVDQYIRIARGNGTYYVPNGMMTAEVSKKEALEMSWKFLILSIVMLIMFVCFMIWKHKRVIHSILEILGFTAVIIVSDVIWKFWCVEIYRTTFPIQWVLGSTLIIYAGINIALLLVYRSSYRRVYMVRGE